MPAPAFEPLWVSVCNGLRAAGVRVAGCSQDGGHLVKWYVPGAPSLLVLDGCRQCWRGWLSQPWIALELLPEDPTLALSAEFLFGPEVPGLLETLRGAQVGDVGVGSWPASASPARGPAGIHVSRGRPR